MHWGHGPPGYRCGCLSLRGPFFCLCSLKHIVDFNGINYGLVLVKVINGTAYNILLPVWSLCVTKKYITLQNTFFTSCGRGPNSFTAIEFRKMVGRTYSTSAVFIVLLLVTFPVIPCSIPFVSKRTLLDIVLPYKRCPVDTFRQKKAPTFQSRLGVRVHGFQGRPTYYHGVGTVRWTVPAVMLSNR